ncbi:PIG-P-domain-containing protein [Immersiella caudata]|uniref:PIG-P-domain-containing protein n=1 Tax=Immersiella caudata TaxID=314043 RepID=A0AA39XEZ0_9PEZI|nr:PIG-P-domain-containing protein [Immersiella caudata]
MPPRQPNANTMPITSEEEEDDGDFPLLSSNHPASDASTSDDLSSASASASDEEDEDEPLPLPQPFSQHTFAPPFYGRPPTPLPPSPSLTSLLRPSRPTTPDQSDDDNPAEPLPRASPKVPTYEYYGFVLYLFSSLCFLIYLLWSYLPSPFLHALGIYYYPNRWWSLAIPSFLVMLYVYIYVALAAYNTEIMTLPLRSIETIVDDAAKVAVVDSKGRLKVEGGKRRGERRSRQREEGLVAPGSGLNWRNVWNEGTDAVMDVPLAGVCEVLYGEGRDVDEEIEEGDADVAITWI